MGEDFLDYSEDAMLDSMEQIGDSCGSKVNFRFSAEKVCGPKTRLFAMFKNENEMGLSHSQAVQCFSFQTGAQVYVIFERSMRD